MSQDMQTVTSGAAVPDWGAAKRVGFRLAFSYFVFYYLGTILSLLGPVARVLGSPIGPRRMYLTPWDQLATWTAVHVFSLDRGVVVHGPTGSTDTAIDYIRTGWMLLVAVAAAALWSAVDRNRGEYRALYGCLRSFVRYALAMSLLTYGFNKVFPVQMLPVGLYTTGLIQAFGDKSPAGLLWSFVGYSIPYQMFSGAAELIGGMLLLTRRTATLGAVVSVAVLLNVVFLNFSYDVSVKLFSSNLLLAAVFLALPDLSKLVRFFVLNQPVDPPTASGAPRGGRRVTIGSIAFKILFAVFVYQTVAGAYNEFKLQAAIPSKTPLYGIYDVEKFQRNDEDVPPLATDHRRWKRLIMESPTVVQAQLMDDSFERYRAEYDQARGRLRLFPGGGKSEPSSVFACSRPDADRLQLEGRVGADTLVLSLRRIDPKQFLLLNRGFHWVQETSLIR